MQSGTINVDRPFEHQSGALIAGDGTFDVVNATLTLDGDVGPGTSAPGILTWTRDYAPASGSALVIEVQDESGAGAGHDQLQVSRNVDVTQSTLRVEGSANACADAAPCEYVILAFEGSFSGPFAVEDLPSSNAAVIYPDDAEGTAGQVVLRAEGPLPVELASFTAALDGEAAVLQWQTAGETNNAGFGVEHRAPGTDAFAEVAFVEGHGTTTEAQRYTHRLNGLAPGTHTFRLKQVDLDGALEYSAEVEVGVEMTEAFRLEAAAPNPFRSQATLRFAVREAQTVRVDLYDVLGRRTRVLFEGEVPAGEMQRVQLEGSGLSSGLYFVRLTGQSFAETQRVTLVQ